jgi:hypothetical protein
LPRNRLFHQLHDFPAFQQHLHGIALLAKAAAYARDHARCRHFSRAAIENS